MLKGLLDLKNFSNYKHIKNIKKANQSLIIDLISNSSLLISDFSSVIFEFIYRRKPIVLFIPDIDDPSIKDNYKGAYYNIIQSLKNGTIFFMNKFFNLNKAIDKIIYYINNNFIIEKKVKKFYDSFNISSKNNTIKFIDYLKNLK